MTTPKDPETLFEEWLALPEGVVPPPEDIAEFPPKETEPLPKLDFSKGYRYPPEPGDPDWETLTWWDRNVLAKGRRLTEEDLAYLRQSLFKMLKA